MKVATFGQQSRKGEGGEEVIDQIPNICDRSLPLVPPLKVLLVTGVLGLPAKKGTPTHLPPRLKPFFDRTIKAFVPTY